MKNTFESTRQHNQGKQKVNKFEKKDQKPAFLSKLDTIEKDIEKFNQNLNSLVGLVEDYQQKIVNLNQMYKQVFQETRPRIKRRKYPAFNIEKQMEVKRTRRNSQNISKQYYCMFPGCEKTYVSESSVRIHIRRKHEHVNPRQFIKHAQK